MPTWTPGSSYDHRLTRALVRERARDARAEPVRLHRQLSVLRRGRGAARSVTGTCRRPYQRWTRRNFVLNDLDFRRHSLVCEDVLEFLAEAVRGGALRPDRPPTRRASPTRSACRGLRRAARPPRARAPVLALLAPDARSTFEQPPDSGSTRAHGRGRVRGDHGPPPSARLRPPSAASVLAGHETVNPGVGTAAADRPHGHA